MTKTLVTGANGLLGANIVRELQKRGREVRILVRGTSLMTGLSGTDPEIFHGDILNRESLRRAVSGCSEVIHAAANTSQWPVHFRHYEAVNVTGTLNVMEACRDHEVRRVVYVSTANVFGPGSKDEPGSELSEFTGFRSGSGYIISKYIAQQKVLQEVEKHGTPVVIVNPTFMIGPFDARPSSGKIIIMGLNRKVQLIPRGGKNFIHAGDAAIGACNALERGRIGDSYLLANENLTYEEFYRLLNRITGQRPAMVGIPSSLLMTIGTGGSLAEKVIRRPAPLNIVNARLLKLNNYYTGEKAVRELGLPQTPVETAIKDALRWFGS